MLTFKVDVSVWDELIALIAMSGGVAALYVYSTLDKYQGQRYFQSI